MRALLLLLLRWSISAASIWASEVTLSPAPTGQTGGPWGEAAGGLQATLRTESLEWWKDETPVAFLTIRNGAAGDSPMIARQEEVAEVEIDGKWYRWTGPIDVLSTPLPPGQQIERIPIHLAAKSWAMTGPGSAPLAWTPGWHSIRIRLPVEDAAQPTLHVVSPAVQLRILPILEPAPPVSAAGEPERKWSRPADGLVVSVIAAKPSFQVGDNVVLHFTYLNFTDAPIIHLDADDKQRGTFHEMTFTDATGNAVASESPSERSDQYVKAVIPPQQQLERIVWLNYWKLAGLGHPYTPVGEEARTFRVTPVYRTPVGLDMKEEGLWLGAMEAPPVTIVIAPKAPPRIVLEVKGGMDASSEARKLAEEKGIAAAKADIERGRPAILYYGIPWSLGKPLIDEQTGLAIEVVDGCTVMPPFAAAFDAYNQTIRAWHAAQHPAK